ncbi:uncharacterized protein LOC121051831 [Rosa chinensis]|uniref:uncharacterized protein LOC121051831 n=1 Tax=Rosa chinensis TaxID=74649 RepID=UPI001AD8BC4D|nr:uncharacterized protein LOC121051831 [Rosa chinensis]
MPCPTARPRGVVVGQARKGLVSGDGWFGQSRGCRVVASLTKALGGVDDGGRQRRLDGKKAPGSLEERRRRDGWMNSIWVGRFDGDVLSVRKSVSITSSSEHLTFQ